MKTESSLLRRPSPPDTLSQTGTAHTLIGLGVFSLIYYFDVILRARSKLLWYDELITYYSCGLPDWHSTWAAAVRGADSNDPLFYVITRASEWLFGDGLVGIR